MIQHAHTKLHGVLVRLRLASNNRNRTSHRQALAPSQPCTTMQRVILIVWFFVLPMTMSRMDEAIAADPNVPPQLVADEPAFFIWPDNTVSLAVPIRNTGAAAVADVEVLSVSLRDGVRLEPQAFPISLEELIPEASEVVRARFSVPAVDGRLYLLTITGRFRYFGSTFGFTVSRFIAPVPPDNGPFTVNTPIPPVKMTPLLAAPLYGPAKPEVTEAEITQGTLLPLGPEITVFPPTPQPSGVQQWSSGAPFVEINRDTASGGPTGIPPDPNAAADTRIRSNSDVALTTYNTRIGVSTDDGQNFTIVNPVAITDPGNPARTTVFPEDDGGLCCDQLVTYVPGSNIFVWILQYWPPALRPGGGSGTATTNRIRVAWATPEDIKSNFNNAWTWIDLTSGLLAIGNDWFDQPDVSFSDEFVFVSMSRGQAGQNMGYPDRRIMARLSLADMLNPQIPTVRVGSFEAKRNGLMKTRFIQNSRDAMRWATMESSSSLVLYEWPDSSNEPLSPPTILTVSSIGTDFMSTDPDGVQWLQGSSSRGGVRGSTYETTVSGLNVRIFDLAVDSGRQASSGRPHPYVRVTTITQTVLFLTISDVVKEFDIWNASHGFALAELTHGSTSRATQDLAIVVAAGGGSLYPRYCVGFLGDFIVYWVADNNATEASYQRDSAGNIQTDSTGNNIIQPRYGDYSSVRLTADSFSTLVYQVTTMTPGREACASGQCTTTVRYVEWGRPEELIE